MTTVSNCINCNTDVEIEENLFFIPAAKCLEKADCPSCNTTLFEKEISGWFYVSVYNSNRKDDKQVIYPMP